MIRHEMTDSWRTFKTWMVINRQYKKMQLHKNTSDSLIKRQRYKHVYIKKNIRREFKGTVFGNMFILFLSGLNDFLEPCHHHQVASQPGRLQEVTGLLVKPQIVVYIWFMFGLNNVLQYNVLISEL